MPRKLSSRRAKKIDNNDALSVLSLTPAEITERAEAGVRAVEMLHAANKAAAIAADNAVTSNEIKNDKKVSTAAPAGNSSATGSAAANSAAATLGRATKMSGLQAVAKSGVDSTFASMQTTGVRAAGAVLGGIANSSGMVAKGLSALASGINVTSLGFTVMTKVVEKVVSTFIEMYSRMQKLMDESVTISMMTGDDIANLKDYGDAQKLALNEMAGSSQFFDEDVTTSLKQLISTFKNDQAAITEFTDEALILNKLGISLSGNTSKLLRNQYYAAGKGVETTNSLLNSMVNLSRQSTLTLEEILSTYEQSRVEGNSMYADAIASGMDAETAARVADNFQNLDLALTAMASDQGLAGSGEDVLKNLIYELSATASDKTKFATVAQKGVALGLYEETGIEALRDQILSGDSNAMVQIAGDFLKSYTKAATGPKKDIIVTVAEQLGFGNELQQLRGTFRPNDADTTAAIASLNKNYNDIVNAPENGTESVVRNLLATMGKEFAAFWEMLATKVFAGLGPNDLSNALKGLIKLMGGPAAVVDWMFRPLPGFTNLKKENKENTENGGGKPTIPPYARFLNPAAVKPEDTSGKPEDTGGPDDTLSSPSTSAWYTQSDAMGTAPWRLSAGYLSPAYRANFGRDHYGADYAAAKGTALPSTTDGTVTAVGYDKNSGNYVKVTDSSGFTHFYGHLDSVDVVKGQQIKAGMSLGRVGSTGRSTGPHVHYGVTKDGKRLNPAQWARGTFAKGVRGSAGATMTADTTTVPATSATDDGAGVVSSLASLFGYQNNTATYASRYGVGGPATSSQTSAADLYDAANRPTAHVASKAVTSQVDASSAYDTTGVSRAINGLTQVVSSKLDIIIGQMVRQSLTKSSVPLENSFIYK